LTESLADRLDRLGEAASAVLPGSVFSYDKGIITLTQFDADGAVMGIQSTPVNQSVRGCPITDAAANAVMMGARLSFITRLMP